jgi:Uma2 family endonuclease
LTGIQEYVLIEQDAPQVEIFRRRTNWQCETFKSGDSVVFESVGHAMTVEQIYRRVFD